MIKILGKSYALLIWGAFILLICVCQSTGSSLDACETKECDYAVYSRGMKVGELKSFCGLVEHENKRVLKFASTMHVKVNLLIYSFKMDNREEALIAKEGTIRYSRATREKNRICEVEGRLAQGRFVLDVMENGVRRTMVVDRDKYDCTTMECPETAMKHEGEEMTLRLLDLETLMVVSRRYRWVKNEEIAVDGRNILCRVIDFVDANKKCRRWIRPDADGAIIVRQDGTGKNGRYSLRMVHLKNGT